MILFNQLLNKKKRFSTQEGICYGCSFSFVRKMNLARIFLGWIYGKNPFGMELLASIPFGNLYEVGGLSL